MRWAVGRVNATSATQRCVPAVGQPWWLTSAWPTVGLVMRTQGLLRNPPRPRGLRSNLLMIAEMINKFHRKLFSQIIHPGHCLYQLLPSKTSAHCRYSLRERQHSFQLSKFELSQFKTVSSIDAYLNLDDFCITVRCVFLILCTLFVNSTFYFV